MDGTLGQSILHGFKDLDAIGIFIFFAALFGIRIFHEGQREIIEVENGFIEEGFRHWD